MFPFKCSYAGGSSQTFITHLSQFSLFWPQDRTNCDVLEWTSIWILHLGSCGEEVTSPAPGFQESPDIPRKVRTKTVQWWTSGGCRLRETLNFRGYIRALRFRNEIFTEIARTKLFPTNVTWKRCRSLEQIQTLYLLISRPGRSQGLLYKHRHQSFIHWKS